MQLSTTTLYDIPSSSFCASGCGTNTGSEGQQSVSPQHFVVLFVTSSFNILRRND